MLAATTTVLLRQTVRAPLTSQGKALVEDDGFLKEHFGEYWVMGLCLSTPAAQSGPVKGGARRPLLLSPGREPLVGCGGRLSPGEGETRTEGIGGEEGVWGRVRDQSVSSLAWRREAGSWHETGQSSRLCSSVKDS